MRRRFYMSIVLYALGIIVNGIIGVLPDLTVNIAANIIYDKAKKIHDIITIRKGRNLQVLHPVIETALVNSFYNAIILSLTKTREYYKTAYSYVYKKEILQISARIKDLTKLLKGQSSSGYSLLIDSFCEVMGNSTAENTNRLIMIAKNNLIGLSEKTKSDLENNFIGIFLVFFKEKFASDETLKSLLTFDMLQANLSVATDTNKKIDSLIYSHINIETELNNISLAVSNLPTNSDYAEIRSMLIVIQSTLTQLAHADGYEISSEMLLSQSYLDVIFNKYRHVELPSFDGTRKRTTVKDIYSPLELINRIAVTVDNDGRITKLSIAEIDDYNISNPSKNPFLIERMFMFDVFLRNRNAFIIGESGTGKSIAAQHLLCCLSGYQSTEADYWNNERLKFGLTDFEQIPIFVSLLDYFRHNQFGNGANSVLSYLQNEFSLQENLLDFLKKKLVSGKAILIIEDCAFSEVPASSVLADIADFINNYSRCRYIIFRSIGNDMFYSQHSVFDDISKFELARLSIKTMRELAEKYCSVLSMVYDVSNFSFENFFASIKKIGLQALSEKPYWFSLLLLMYCALEELPDNTYSIHIKIADNMLNRLVSSLDNFSVADKQNTFLAFELLSVKLFYAISKSKVVSKILLQEILEKYLTSEKTSALMKKIKSSDCELLIYNTNDSINYNHKPLIDALVARYFKRNMDSISTLIDNTIKMPAIWMESFALLFDEKNYDLLAFVLFMLQNACDSDKSVSRKISLYILSKVNAKDFSVRPERIVLVKLVIQAGKEMIDSGSLSIPDRIIVSQELSIISVVNDFYIDFDMYFSMIPSGVVVLGNDRLTLGDPYEYEVTYDYYAAKLPVTNLEYQQFLLETSEYPIPFDETNIWDANTRQVDKRYLNHPVVGVSFHDALNFCKWIGTKMDIPKGYKIWLPSDPEWMKMYRGGKEIKGIANEIPDRIYPWGNEWIEGYANLSKLESPICSTTAVGIFIESASIYGCQDTCGNVLEWTTTSWGGFNPDTPEYHHPYTPLDGREDLELPGLRITRGGSFLFSEGDAKCSCRLDPESKFPDTGFRIFLVPDEKSKITD